MENNNVTYTTGKLTCGSSTLEYPYFYNNYYYPCYPIYEKSKVDIAFGVITKLMEKSIIKTLNIKQFIEAVNEISKLL